MVEPLPSSGPPAIHYNSVSKNFGATTALADLSLDVLPGSIHAFVGENGAGKSTAIGIVAGVVPASAGDVKIFGNELRLGDPRASRAARVAAIFQELTIVPALSADANVFLGGQPTHSGFVLRAERRARYLELCDRLKVAPVASSTRAGDLSVADQQLLEIMRALATEARVFLFDEPTASLAVPEREALLSLLQQLRDGGVTIVLVSHNLDEVFSVADTISVFRNGRLVASAPTDEWERPELVRAMLGRSVSSRIVRVFESEGETIRKPRANTRRTRAEHAVLRVEDASIPGVISGISLEVSAGEIVGLGGLVGSGRTSFMRSLAGAAHAATGRLWIDGRERPWPRTIRAALSYGIAYVSEDRKHDGLLLSMTAASNIVMSDLESTTTAGFLNGRRLTSVAASAARASGFDETRLRSRARELSGGNQQKLLLARWMHRPLRLLLADEPTRGVDIGAKEGITETLEGLAAGGMAILFASSELEEVAAISDRVLVLREGHAVGELQANGRGQIRPIEILQAALGSSEGT